MTNFCPWEPAHYLIFSENIPPLLYYSHFTTVAVAFFVLFFLFRSSTSPGRNLLIILLTLFSAWALIDVIVWATNRFDVVMFWWALIVFIEPLIYCVAFYLLYAFIYKKFPGFKINLSTFILLLPFVLFLPTDLNLSAINTYDCTAAEGPLALYYTYFIEILSILGIIFLMALDLKNNPEKQKRRANVFFAIGLIAFLVSFASGNIIGSMTDDWELAQYGLFGMPLFMAMITYMMVEFKLFSVNLMAAQALVISLIALVGSVLLVDAAYVRPVAALTLIFTLFSGIFLIRSVKREVQQRNEIQHLAENLERANKRLQAMDKQKSEFVSIASHQLRSPLTAIRGYASLLIDGDYGKIPQKAEEPLQRIAESSRLMALAIEDYLNVSRIEAGNMKYNYSDFNLKEEVEKLCDDQRREAMKKGLSLIFRSDVKSRSIINADLGKTVQIVQNLINNSIKYTLEGSIRVFVWDDITRKKIHVDITDTGIGMSQDDIDNIFDKFERAKNANSVNIHGTGLGLFVALRMAEAMGGTITAHSDGEGKGSRFTLELPLAL